MPIDKYRFPSLRETDRRHNSLIVGRDQPKAIEKNNIDDVRSHGSYGVLLFDERWRNKRQEILNRDRNRCVICNSSNELQVHHRQYHFIKAAQKYKVPWDYDNSLLITLCKSCHNRGHNKFKVPTLSI